MKKNFFTFDFIVVLVTMAAGAYVMYSRAAFHARQTELKSRYDVARDELLRRAVSSQRPAPPPRDERRNILFAMKSSTAKRVTIVGDFNDWIPAEMQRDNRGMWTLALKIPPGEYAYNFIVDGRPARDFNNPRTKDTGRGFVSSLVEVRPLETDKQ